MSTVPSAFSVERQIMWDRLIAIVEEQAQTILRTAFSSVVSEAGDLSAGVFDVQGRMLAQAATGTPGHVNSMALSVVHFLDRFPLATMRPGDVFLTNDPWLATGHLHDFTVVTPVFSGDVAVALFAATCHMVDIGGLGFGTDAKSIYEEGLAIPPLRIVERGEINTIVLDIIRANVREPLLVEGDLHSLLAANERGSVRLLQMMREFDIDTLGPLADWIVDTSRDAMLRAIAELRPGSYSHSTQIDGFDAPVTLAATLTIGVDGIDVDFTGTSAGSAFGVNVPLAYAAGYACYGIRCAVGSRIPNNTGSLSVIRVTAPEGCILNAQRPAAVAARGATGHMIPDLLLGCLHLARVAAAPAENCSCIWGPMLYSVGNGMHFALVNAYAGGMGARSDRDGLSATGFPSGIRCTPVEVTESVAPVVIWRKELRQDSGGPGQFRGGLGQTMQVGHLRNEPFAVSAMFERIVNAAKGRDGGAAGCIRTTADRALEGKGRQSIEPGECLVLEMPGGGGFGPASARDLNAVRDDVIDGRISREGAWRDYGVEILSDGTARPAADRGRGSRP